MRWHGVKVVLRDKPEIAPAAASAFVGLVLGVLSIFGVNDLKILLAVTQVTLGSLSWNIFRNQLDNQSRNASIDQMAGLVKDTATVVRNLSAPMIFDRQKVPYDQLLHDIAENGARKAVFIQYSGQQSAEVLQAVLRSPGAVATVYLQDERTAAKIGSGRQAARIAHSIHNTLSDWRRNFVGLSQLHVYTCTMPMSVRAVMIDDRIICMGWYTYEPDDRADAGDYRDDTVAVSGDDIATVVARRGTHEFDALNSTLAMLISKYERYRGEPWLRPAFTGPR